MQKKIFSSRNRRGKYKSVLKEFVLVISTIIVIVAGIGAVRAEDRIGVDKIRDVIEKDGKSLLPNYDLDPHYDLQSYDYGIVNIGSAILYFTDFLKYIMGTVAIIFIFVAAVRIISAGKNAEEVFNAQKENLTYIITGLLVIIISTEVVNTVFSEVGQLETFQTEADAQEKAENAANIVRGIYNFIEAFIGGIAILVIAIAGFRIITGGGSEDIIATQKHHIVYASVGLIFIGISELIVKDLIFSRLYSSDEPGSYINYEAGLYVFASLTNFIASMVSLFAVFAIFYAGALYIFSRGDEESGNKAKKIVWGALIAIIITAGAYALINAIIGLNPQ